MRRAGRKPHCGFWPLLLLAALMGWGGPVWADLSEQLDSAERQLGLLENKAKLVRLEYLQFEDRGETTRHFEERLNDGQAMMLLKDYVRAAIVFTNLVENEKNRQQSGYADAVFNLGEALFFNKNFLDARAYYRQVIEDPRGRPYRKLALGRLMQIALNTGDYDQVDAVHERLQREGSGSSDTDYLWAKTLFQRNRQEEAAAAFGGIAAGQPKYFQSRYFLGVVRIRQGRLEEALALYGELARLPTKRESERDVVELAHLARGRLLHDLGREAEALDAFQAIEHTSIHFDDALLEICWTNIGMSDKAEQPEQRLRYLTDAARAMEILEVSTTNTSLVPRANLIKGHILEKMDRHEDAAEVFRAISGTYASVRQELDSLLASHDDPVRYFNEVAGKNLDSFDLATYLPPLAVQWMSGQDDMAAALGVVRDIEAGQRFVTESHTLLAKLDELVDNEKERVGLFPLLRDGMKRAIEVENARVILESNLAHFEERVVLEHVSATERAELTRLRNERESLEQKVESLPVTSRDRAGQEARQRQRLEQLEESVFQSGIALQGMKAQLTAMDVWLRGHEAELAGRQQAVTDFREELRRGWSMATSLQGELDSLNSQLSTEKMRVGLDADSQNREDVLRNQYDAALQRERSLAEQIHQRLGPEGTVAIGRINEMRLRAEHLRREVGRIRAQLTERASVDAERLKAQVQRERENLDAFSAALGRLNAESGDLAGVVAFRALREVRERFYRLVLEADVGLLDVAWSRKQQKTDKISELGRRLGDERKRLFEEFRGVLQQVD